MTMIYSFLLCFSSLIFAQERLEIIKIGHPTLRETAIELNDSEIQSSETQKLIDNMIYTMSQAGGVGLAAPQVNKSIRLFVMKSWPQVQLTVVINPKIEYLDEFGKKISSEGCLSIPGKTLKVKRFNKIHLSYFDRKGVYISKQLEGFAAIIAQHEYDHLNGVLIIDIVEQLFSEFNFYGIIEAPLM